MSDIQQRLLANIERTKSLWGRSKVHTNLTNEYRKLLPDLTAHRRAEVWAELETDHREILQDQRGVLADAIGIFQEMLAIAVEQERFEDAAMLQTEIDVELVRLAEVVGQLELIDGTSVLSV